MNIETSDQNRELSSLYFAHGFQLAFGTDVMCLL